MIVLITCNSNLVTLLEGLYSSNPCGFEFKFLPETKRRPEVLCPDQMSGVYIVSDLDYHGTY